MKLWILCEISFTYAHAHIYSQTVIPQPHARLFLFTVILTNFNLLFKHLSLFTCQTLSNKEFLLHSLTAVHSFITTDHYLKTNFCPDAATSFYYSVIPNWNLLDHFGLFRVYEMKTIDPNCYDLHFPYHMNNTYTYTSFF